MVGPSQSAKVQDCLKKLAQAAYASSQERDELLQVVREAPDIKPRDVVWMLFRPDRGLREAGVELLRGMRATDTADLIVSECKGQPEVVIRVVSPLLFGLGIPGLEGRLGHLLTSGDEGTRETLRRLFLEAPVSRELAPMLWELAGSIKPAERAAFLDRLEMVEMTTGALERWRALARDEDQAVREKALTVLARKAPAESVDTLVAELPRATYATQQHVIQALTGLVSTGGLEIVERILPLMASGQASTRSAVIKVLLAAPNRGEVIRRYLIFSKTLAGWARERALESMHEFGNDLVEPTIELLADPDENIRTTALAVASSFEDTRIVPATIGLLTDPDWWLRITAAESLGRLKDQRAVEPLIEALSDPDTRWGAVEALGRIGNARALPALGQLLADPAPEVRIEILMALRNFKHPQILDGLRHVAASDPVRFVRARALEIAEEVARRDKTEFTEAAALRSLALKAHVGSEEPVLHALLVQARNAGASDLHIAVSQPPILRIAADLTPIEGEPLSSEQTQRMLREILTEEQWHRLEKQRQVDFCYFLPAAGRYRANVFLDQHGYNGVFRVIPEKPPTITEIGLPGHLAEIADYHQGLVLICGPSNSGKSTTLAALINLFNETCRLHILSLEDPVEFVHPFKSCLINQREVGSHTGSYAKALRAALREDPDVIVIGDLRDTETVALALTAAETGHIVLATLNSASAPKAVDRIISSFPADQQGQIRAALGDALKFVIGQRLLPAMGARRLVACFEILKCTVSVANLIREEKTIQIPSLMQVGRAHGMQTTDEALLRLVKQGLISAETAYMAASTRKDFEALVSSEFLESRTFL